MMWEYFAIREDPFGAVPDPRFLYLTQRHREALASLHYGFVSNRGFTSLIAEPGLGKTTLLVAFLERIRSTARTVFLFDTQCDAAELLAFILHDLGIVPGPDRVAQHEQLHGVLLAEARALKKVVVIIDEAQNLSPDALEAVRLLSNFETSSAKLLQIVLAGQPQLGDRLSSPEMAQLRQRISIVCRLEPFTRQETAAYIGHRLTVAGHSGPALFTSAGIDAIHEASHGIPRIINHICFHALSLAYALKRKQVDVAIVAEVVADRELATSHDPAKPPVPTEIVQPETPAGEPKGKTWRWVFAAGILLVLAMLGRWDMRRAAGDAVPAPGASRTSIEAAASLSRPTPMAEARRNVPYVEVTVQPDETLTDIATERLGGFNDSILKQIETLNPRLADNPDHIETGQKLRLPTPAAAPVSSRED